MVNWIDSNVGGNGFDINRQMSRNYTEDIVMAFFTGMDQEAVHKLEKGCYPSAIDLISGFPDWE